jgi:predicted RNA binding protein YcfA (HicA-like mRNA interferase family)
MKRRDLVAHLLAHGCELHREGGNHSVYVNRANRTSSAVPRHREIDEHIAAKICKDLGISRP